ncbi:TPA: fimbria/pilus outer membrane usher protein [Salmonella enterica]
MNAGLMDRRNFTYFALNPLTRALLLALALGGIASAKAQDSVPTSAATETTDDTTSSVTEFNIDVMDVGDRNNVDVSHFSRAGYVMPGDYPLTLNVNGAEVREVNVTFAPTPDAPKDSMPCLTSEMVSLFGLKTEEAEKLTWKTLNGARCLDERSLPGMTARGDLGTASLKVTIPQAYLEYSSPNWDPPSRWDNGVTGLLFDYNLNVTKSHRQQDGNDSNLSGSGAAGFNFGPWRLRADWQAQRSSSDGHSTQNFDWSRYYLYRALPKLGAKLMIGESDLDSSLFDSFHFVGASLNTEDSMLPPNLQGYAPEVTGLARSNAKVTISQQGRVIYESQVAPGPFRIQELSSAVSGTLDVRVEEQDGGVQTFQVNTASIPYLTRPGMVRYKLTAGRPTDWKHHVEGETFGTGEFSWGVSNGWSLFGGMVAAKDYTALGMGIGRDLLAFGALSFDVTESHVSLPREGTKTGGSYRLSYSKRFEKIDGQITFAGYRFSEKDFMSMGDYLERRYQDSDWEITQGREKELYTITVSKSFADWKTSLYGDYSHRTYWDRPDNDRYSLTLSQYLDIGAWRNISLSLTGYRSNSWGIKDDGAYISISVPWSNGGSLSYNGQNTRNGTSQTVGWYDTIDSNNSYSMQAGTSTDDRTMVSGYMTHNGDIANATLSASYTEGSYSSQGLSLQGGITATRYGVALHPGSSNGGTRLMIDTGDAAEVPLSRGTGAIQRTNMFGKGVIGNLGSYWRNTVGVDVNALSDRMEVTHPLTELTLTEGAIGYRKINVLQGRKLMAVIKFADGSSPAFGSTVWRGTHQTGVVDDAGNIWLAGVVPGAVMEVHENEMPVCRATVPERLPAEDSGFPLLLTCQPLRGKA